MENRKLYLEICCGSLQDVLEAARGGADRVELNSDLFHGGLTPTLGALRLAKKYTDIPVMCMVRPREGGFCYTQTEYELMLEEARIFLENGADGIVFGFLHEDGTVDEERCAAMMDVIGGKTSVFHRAIDVAADPIATLDILIGLGITRVLTSGQAPTVPEGIPVLQKMIGHAAGRIEILPGGGITPGNAAWCRQMLGVDMLHAAIHRTAYDRSCDGNPAIYFGGAVYPPEDRYQVTAAADVQSLRRAAEAAAF